MSKLSFLLGSSTFMIITTFFVDSIETVDSSGIPIETMPTEPPTGLGGMFDAVRSIATTFFRILSFNIEGLPSWVSLIFIIIAIGIMYVIIDILKDLVPLT